VCHQHEGTRPQTEAQRTIPPESARHRLISCNTGLCYTKGVFSVMFLCIGMVNATRRHAPCKPLPEMSAAGELVAQFWDLKPVLMQPRPAMSCRIRRRSWQCADNALSCLLLGSYGIKLKTVYVTRPLLSVRTMRCRPGPNTQHASGWGHHTRRDRSPACQACAQSPSNRCQMLHIAKQGFLEATTTGPPDSPSCTDF
jgi:hypothetical protein